VSATSRPDGATKLAGAATYGEDVELPGMLWGALVMSPVPHGRLRSVDLAPARALPGVIAISAPDVPSLVDGRQGDPDRPPFPPDHVTYLHQPIAAVAAPSRPLARAAARSVRVTVDPLPVASDLDALFPEWPESKIDDPSRVAAHVLARRGDVERAFREGETIVAETYRTASVHQVALEPHACVADVREGVWRVRTSTQSPFGAREDTASILGLPEASIVVEGTWVGGGFGGKGAAFLEPYALLLSRAAGRPVRLALTYAEEFRLGRTTLPSVIRLETAVSKGEITGRRVRLLLDVGTSLPGRDFATGYSIGFLLGPYRTPAFEVEGYAVRTNKPPFGPHRAPFAPQAVFAVESHLESVARAAQLDPAAFKARHLWREGDRTPFGQRVLPFGLPSALESARATATRWRKDAPAGRGVGIGLGFWSTSTGAGGEARVTLTPTALVVVQGEREIGSGSVVVGLAQVVARRSGLPMEAIRIEHRDTAGAPFDAGVFGSRTVGALGRAIDEAVVQILHRLGDRVTPPGPVTLEFRDGHVMVVHGALRRPLAELLSPTEAAEGGLSAEGKHYGQGGEIDESLVRDGAFYPYTDFTGAAHVAEVEVDRETGSIRVRRYAAFHDAGVVLDLPSARAQIEGGVAMGLGAALTEEAIWSDDGRLENAGLVDYRIPTLGEIPPIEVHFIEGYPGAGPFGAKGLGEPPIIPVPATIAAAVRDACGAHVTELPLSPDRVAQDLKLR
jgi:CO/xanthine dehydrogenase Mo-binding subunit